MYIYVNERYGFITAKPVEIIHIQSKSKVFVYQSVYPTVILTLCIKNDILACSNRPKNIFIFNNFELTL